MALFGKSKKSAADHGNDTAEHHSTADHSTQANDQASTPDFGPFDGDTIDYRTFDFSDFAKGGLDLGSMLVPVPHDGEVQVSMGQNGPELVHLFTPAGRMTPVAFAAPRNGNLWEESMPEVIQGMTQDGLQVRQEQGPWGEEIVAEAGNGTMRVIGVQGQRWMMRMTLASTNEKAEELAQLAREVIARSFVYRGNDPIPAGNVLPVTIPAPMAEALRQQMEQRNRQAGQPNSDQASQQGTVGE